MYVHSIEDYETYQVISYKNFLYYIFAFFLFIFLLSLVIFNKYYDKFYKLNGEVISNNQILLVVPSDILTNIIENNEIKIDNKNFRYKVLEVGKDYLENSGIYYKRVLLNVNFSKDDKYVNSIVSINLRIKHEKVITYIVRLIKGDV